MKGSRWSFVDRCVAAIVGIMLFMAVVWPSLQNRWLPQWEGLFWPVMRPLILTDVKESGPSETQFSGVTYKIRDCYLVRVDWWFRKLDGPALPMRSSLNRRPNRLPVGQSEVGPWVLPVTQMELKDSVFAYAWHSCHHYLPWLTRTAYYPEEQRTLEN